MIRKVVEPSTDASEAATAPSDKSSYGVRAVLTDLFDTTMRLFVPSVGGTAVGLWLDITNNTRPWFTIIGVIGGSLIAVALIALQLKAIDKKRNTPTE